MNVERRIYDLGLPHRAVTVYCYLCDRSNKQGECFPSAKTIAQDLSLSRRTVFRALHELLEKDSSKNSRDFATTADQVQTSTG